MGPHLISASTKKKFRAQGFEAAWSPMYHTQSPTESQPIHLTIFFFFQRERRKNKLIDCCARARAQSHRLEKFKMKKKRQNGRRRDSSSSSSFNSDKKWRPSAERSRFPCLSHRLMDVLLERHGDHDGRPTLEYIKQRNKTLSHTKIVQTRKEKEKPQLLLFG